MNDLAKYLFLLSIFVLVCLTGKTAFATEPTDSADCTINVVVDQICEWQGAAFDDIDLTIIDEMADIPTGSKSFTLWINCNVVLTAENGTTAELGLAGTGDVLKTEYYLDYDGDGAATTGGTDTSYETYDNFITGGSAVTHVDNDGSVEVTLYARADIAEADEVPDAGAYIAVQTLLASWASD